MRTVTIISRLASCTKQVCNARNLSTDASPANYFMRQMFDRSSCTYTYLLADTSSKEALLIDPVIDLSLRDKSLIEKLGFNLKYVMNTHVHADHITGTGRLKKLFPGCLSVISRRSGADADLHVEHGNVLKFGSQELEVVETPGHTNGCVTYIMRQAGQVFTGDALLINGCGRTDFQEGCSNTLYESVWNEIFSLPDHFQLYTGHDYNGFTSTTVAEEKNHNPRLTLPKDKFVHLMSELGLPYPAKIDISLPPNKLCGLQNLPKEMEEWVK